MTDQRIPIRLGPLFGMAVRYSPILILVAIGAFLAVFIGIRAVEGNEEFEAKALLVARDVTIDLDELPETVNVFWSVGGVAERAAVNGDTGLTPLEIFDSADVRVAAGTPTIVVTGRRPDAERAASVANAVAAAVRETVADSGAVGTLTVVERATASRAVISSGLPVWPLSVAAGAGTAIVALVLLFVMRQPVHLLSDLTTTAAHELADEVWVTTSPPIEGKVRSFAMQLEATHPKWRLVHAGFGEDLTEPLAGLVSKHAPGLQLQPNPFSSSNGASAEPSGDRLPDTRWRVALVVTEGTPLRRVLDAQLGAGDDLGAVVLLHPRLA